MYLLNPKKMASLFADIIPNYFVNKLERSHFIIGCGRSGTTIIVDTLAVHPEIATYPDEANVLWHPQTFPWRFSKYKDLVPPIEVEEYMRYSEHISLLRESRSSLIKVP